MSKGLGSLLKAIKRSQTRFENGVFVFESEKRCCFPNSNRFVGDNQVVKKFFSTNGKTFFSNF